jgi:ribosomal protein L32
MPSFLRRLLDRLSKRIDRAAAGTPVPAGIDTRTLDEAPKPTARERTLMRRRLRALEPSDGEARALKEALDQRKTLDELIASGVVEQCPSCGELASPHEAHCSSCGVALRRDQGPRTTDQGPSPQPARVTTAAD